MSRVGWGVVVLVIACGCNTRRDDQPATPSPSKGDPAGDPAGADAGAPAKPRSQCNAEMSTFCDGDDVVECTRDGRRGKPVQSCKAGCKGGACVETCAAIGAELVYVISEHGELMSFDPRKLPQDPFVTIGKLDCPTSAEPFSMAIDNHGVAWVLFDDRTMFRASIHDARCAKTGHAVDGAPSVFGMGFAKDTARGTTETLFVADNDDADGKQQLASVDTSASAPVYRAVGKLLAEQRVSPELTGTADAKLFGYFPDPGRGFITEIDRKTGRSVGRRHRLPASVGEVNAFAFAHWGGTFYIFTSSSVGENKVHAVDRKTGRYSLALDSGLNEIVGAGVSTCAPLLERAP